MSPRLTPAPPLPVPVPDRQSTDTYVRQYVGVGNRISVRVACTLASELPFAALRPTSVCGGSMLPPVRWWTESPSRTATACWFPRRTARSVRRRAAPAVSQNSTTNEGVCALWSGQKIRSEWLRVVGASRAADMLDGLHTSGCMVAVRTGGANARRVYVCVNDPGSDVVGQHPLQFRDITAVCGVVDGTGNRQDPSPFGFRPSVRWRTAHPDRVWHREWTYAI